jgi:hypothetical protein
VSRERGAEVEGERPNTMIGNRQQSNRSRTPLSGRVIEAWS